MLIRSRIGNRLKKKHLLVSESYCTIVVVLFIYVSYTNNICLYQSEAVIEEVQTIQWPYEKEQKHTDPQNTKKINLVTRTL